MELTVEWWIVVGLLLGLILLRRYIAWTLMAKEGTDHISNGQSRLQTSSKESLSAPRAFLEDVQLVPQVLEAENGLVRLPMWRDEKGALQTPYGTVYEDDPGKCSLEELGTTGYTPSGVSYQPDVGKFVRNPKVKSGNKLISKLKKGR
jgi:hypothetical protein